MRRLLFVRWPPSYRPATHLFFAAWSGVLALVGARIWLRAFEEGVLDVRGPALERANGPLLYWMAMAGAAAVLLVVAVSAFMLAVFFLINVSRGRRAR